MPRLISSRPIRYGALCVALAALAVLGLSLRDGAEEESQPLSLTAPPSTQSVETAPPEPAVESPAKKEDPTVYTVGNYTVYHRQSCRYVQNPAGQVFSGPRSVVREQNFTACEECKPG